MDYRSVPKMPSLSDCESSATHGSASEEDTAIIKKGPWTQEEDSILMDYISRHGEGHWNSVARCAGLNRTGKSCRLRWLNYLRPNVRRGNITLQEQLLILELHFRWGNRWSKIAQHLPGRTDNEIKNYWRTRVVKQAKQLKCDVNSKQFREALRFVWMPRLLERIQASSSGSGYFRPDSDPCFTTEPSFHSGLLDDVQPPSASRSDSAVSCNLTEEAHVEYSSGVQAFEATNGFGVADLWTDENIWFLQQQLCDDV